MLFSFHLSLSFSYLGDGLMCFPFFRLHCVCVCVCNAELLQDDSFSNIVSLSHTLLPSAHGLKTAQTLAARGRLFLPLSFYPSLHLLLPLVISFLCISLAQPSQFFRRVRTLPVQIVSTLFVSTIHPIPDESKHRVRCIWNLYLCIFLNNAYFYLHFSLIKIISETIRVESETYFWCAFAQWHLM